MKQQLSTLNLFKFNPKQVSSVLHPYIQRLSIHLQKKYPR